MKLNELQIKSLNYEKIKLIILNWMGSGLIWIY